jgi:hypothetical protein
MQMTESWEDYKQIVYQCQVAVYPQGEEGRGYSLLLSKRYPMVTEMILLISDNVSQAEKGLSNACLKKEIK